MRAATLSQDILGQGWPTFAPASQPLMEGPISTLPCLGARELCLCVVVAWEEEPGPLVYFLSQVSQDAAWPGTGAAQIPGLHSRALPLPLPICPVPGLDWMLVPHYPCPALPHFQFAV